jgi:hypothetical protein
VFGRFSSVVMVSPFSPRVPVSTHGRPTHRQRAADPVPAIPASAQAITTVGQIPSGAESYIVTGPFHITFSPDGTIRVVINEFSRPLLRAGRRTGEQGWQHANLPPNAR